jgi:hypothetical protein
MSDFPVLTNNSHNRIVYVRPVDVATLPKTVRDQVEGDGPVFAIHDSDGAVLALAMDRSMAFAVARMNKLAPVSVH